MGLCHETLCLLQQAVEADARLALPDFAPTGSDALAVRILELFGNGGNEMMHAAGSTRC